MKPIETIYLTALPIAGTAVAYLFESGFAAYHGIPTSLIQLNVSQLVGTAVLGLFLLWIVHLYFALGIAFLMRRKHLIFKFIGLGMLYATLPFLFLLGVGNDNRLWKGFVILFFLPSVLGLILTLLEKNKDKSQPFLQRWWQQSAFDMQAPQKSGDHLDLIIDKPQQWFSFLLLSIFLSFSFGLRYASLAIPTMVLKSDPSKALVVVYGEKWFFRPINEVHHSRTDSKGELLILTGDNIKAVTLIPLIKTNPSLTK